MKLGYNLWEFVAVWEGKVEARHVSKCARIMPSNREACSGNEI